MTGSKTLYRTQLKNIVFHRYYVRRAIDGYNFILSLIFIFVSGSQPDNDREFMNTVINDLVPMDNKLNIFHGK